MIWPYILACLASITTLMIGGESDSNLKRLDVVLMPVYFAAAVIVHLLRR
jgi:hypothetical protein